VLEPIGAATPGVQWLCEGALPSLAAAPPRATCTSSPRISLFGLTIDALNMAQAVERTLAWIDAPGERTRYVVTPNLDHAVLFQRHAGLRAAYAAADLVLADGWPLVAASRWLGQPLPQRVPGSDLVPAVFARATALGRRLRVFLLGAGPGVAERAAANIHRRWPGVYVCGCSSPPLGFERERAVNAQILAQIAAARPQLLVVGLGAPKQELWLHEHRAALRVPVALAVGATIDFLAGHRCRAPRWMRSTGLEWLHRLAGEPRRLAPRYARGAWAFPRLVWREWRGAPERAVGVSD
jgi:N-acetylglucosaminyldiphosphoundecaprenol N-acetyl-beta-D-mannosaminyltransferase